ncbi:hypothetical protein M569_16949 [Genlisea aurea]|uniref:Uncharacterized protein n=1 Tax=Genlisea aurea TaxID=192259 RepID=S8D5I0_9LAMI|nr:hypothetical protein M569_16949 [Genlisea aurea]
MNCYQLKLTCATIWGRNFGFLADACVRHPGINFTISADDFRHNHFAISAAERRARPNPIPTAQKSSPMPKSDNTSEFEIFTLFVHEIPCSCMA